MKFENPIIAISRFEVENVVTTMSTAATREAENAADAAIAAAGVAGGTAKKIVIMY